MSTITWQPQMVRWVDNKQYHEQLREPRIGVMLHFDGSGTDRGAVDWFGDPKCKVSYQYLVLDDGNFVRIAPDSARAWHAGVCRPSSPRLQYHDANSAFFGIAIASNDVVEATALQMLTTAMLVRQYFDAQRWALDELWRIVGHDTEAWPRGRKTDPTGPRQQNPILSVASIRSLVPLIER